MNILVVFLFVLCVLLVAFSLRDKLDHCFIIGLSALALAVFCYNGAKTESDDDFDVESSSDSDYDSEFEQVPLLPQVTLVPKYQDDDYKWGSEEKATNCYPEPSFNSNNCNLSEYLSYDESNARIAALRNRDKKSKDGLVTKNANFYKKNFGRELDEAESRRWWGNDEY
jgi:hypothetical protein